jgi:Fe-S-cluster containining protein
MKKHQKKKAHDTLGRLRFPDDEAKLAWLPMLLEAYAVIDKGVGAAIREVKRARKVALACREGCDRCCTLSDIPVYPFELVGIYWYSTEKVAGPARDILKRQLAGHDKDYPCPFLVNRACSIHPLRPVGCRQFNVFNEPCGVDEDPFFTRRDDVLTPIRDYTHKAFFIMLPFYGMNGREERLRAIESNVIHTQVRNMKTCNWKLLARRMEEFDAGCSCLFT